MVNNVFISRIVSKALILSLLTSSFLVTNPLPGFAVETIPMNDLSLTVELLPRYELEPDTTFLPPNYEAPSSLPPSYQRLDRVQSLAENGEVPHRAPTDPSPSEEERSHLLKIPKPSLSCLKAVACVLAAAGCVTGAVYGSIRANREFNNIRAATAAANAPSEELSSICRLGPDYGSVCFGVSDEICRKNNRFEISSSAQKREYVQWLKDDCSRWTKLEHVWEHDEEQCITSCSTDDKGRTSCSTICSWNTFRDRTDDLTGHFALCPNIADYDKFLTSNEYQRCNQVMETEGKSVTGVTAGAVIGSIAGFGFLCGAAYHAAR